MFRSKAFAVALALAGLQGACTHYAKDDHYEDNLRLNTESPSANTEWRTFETLRGKFLMAVSRPIVDEPKPAIVILHGTHGFALEYVDLAEAFAAAGIVAVAVCWFEGGSGAGQSFVTPMECPFGTPPVVAGTSEDAYGRVDTIIDVVRSLPGVNSDHVVLFGHSRGGVAALSYASRGGNAAALVLNSAAYPDELVEQAGAIAMPVLILHGEDDSPTDGGSPMTSPMRARIFADAMQTTGKMVTTHFYRGGEHNSLFIDRFQRQDSVRRVEAFVEAGAEQGAGP